MPRAFAVDLLNWWIKEVIPVTKETECNLCHKSLKIEGPNPESKNIPNVLIEFRCPFCDTSNAVLWPEGSEYVVSPFHRVP